MSRDEACRRILRFFDMDAPLTEGALSVLVDDLGARISVLS